MMMMMMMFAQRAAIRATLSAPGTATTATTKAVVTRFFTTNINGMMCKNKLYMNSNQTMHFPLNAKKSTLNRLFFSSEPTATSASASASASTSAPSGPSSTAAAAATDTTPTPPISERIRVGVIGAGRMGNLRCQLLEQRVKGADVVMLADPNIKAAKKVGMTMMYPERLAVTTEWQDIMKDPTINAVVIASPVPSHAEQIEAAAKAGKHIFCEKPISLTLPTIDRTLAVVRDSGVKFQIGFNRRLDAEFMRIRRAVVSGEIGTVQTINIISREASPPHVSYLKTSGGIVLDMSIQDFDIARFVVGDEIDEVFARVACLSSPVLAENNDYDTAAYIIRFKNGAVGTITNSRESVFAFDQRMEVFGTAGAINSENHYPNTCVVHKKDGTIRDRPSKFYVDRYIDSYTTEMNSFVDSIMRDIPTKINSYDARVSVQVALAAIKSIAENRPVKVGEVSS